MKNSADKDSNFKPSKVGQVVVTLVFIALLIIPIVLELEAEAPKEEKNVDQARIHALEYFGFYLEDISKVSGVDFIHKAPQLDPQLEHILPTIASVGASVSICDYNEDGLNDIYLTSSRYGEKNALYTNLGQGMFEESAEKLGIGNVNKKGTGVSMGSIWADINNDGFEDLFVYKWGSPLLFLNDGGERFIDITESSGIPPWINANTAVWFDHNNDGLIDLFVGGYYRENIDLWNLENTLIMPESFEYANNGGRNFILENKGDNTFEDITFSKGMLSTKWTLAAGSIDFDDNGYPDLFIANDYSVDELFLNDGDGKFREVGKKSRIGYAPKSGMNVSIADVRNSGNFSVYVSNITEMGILLQGNNMWEIKKDNGQLVFSNNAGIMGIELGGWSYGAQFGDLNNDGYQDLYLANGYISAAKNNSYWYDYSKVTGGNEAIISDALNWPAMQGRSQSGFQKNKVWINSKSGTFADVTDYITGSTTYDSRGVAMVDLDNDGTLDVVVANQRKPVTLYKNHQNTSGNWIAVELEGTSSNRSAIGAQISLHWDGMSQSQIVSGGMGFSSQNQRQIHFGIGQSTQIEKIEIKWPSGRVDTFGPMEINTKHKIVEGNEIS